jgi:ketosteroid isomerase-like protein
MTPVAAQDKNRVNDLKSMVETERAFARMSEEKGTRESFLEFIAADGVLFRPAAVLGKKWMQEHPLPASTSRQLLSWQPIFAAVSRAGDLGYTTGPWQFKPDIKDAKPAAFGNFMTVWRKQADGSWKFALDLGISNPEPKTPATMLQPESNPTAGGSFKRVDSEAARSELLKVDREFARTSADQGAREAFLLFAAKDVRLFRNNHFPFVGRAGAADALAPITAEWTWTPAFAGVSISGDLGYSYGTYELREKNPARTVSEKGNYARVWKKVNEEWKLVIDVADPLPLEKKMS